MDWYPWLKTLHILFAIVAVGVNISYGIWQARATRDRATGYALRGIKFLDDRVANPSYAGLLIVGILLVVLGTMGVHAVLGIYAAIGLYLVMGTVAFFFYSPTLKRQIAAYESERGSNGGVRRAWRSRLAWWASSSL